MENRLTIYVLTAVCFFHISCKQKIIGVVPVIEVEKDLSIPGAGDIKYLIFLSDQIRYAASDSNVIYKTTDEGDSWTSKSIGISGQINGLEFYDESNGLCLVENSLYETDDGGDTWSFNTSADLLGMVDGGIVVIGDCGFASCEIFTSNNTGNSFTSIGDVTMDDEFVNAVFENSQVYTFSSDVSYYDRVYGMDISTKQELKISFDNIFYDELPNDIYFDDDSGGVIVAPNGLIMNDGYFGYSREHYGHTYTFYSVDGYEDLTVCVGEKTIVSNIDTGDDEIEWKDVFDENGNGFDQTFYSIKFIDESTFYLSGSDGLLWRVKI